MRREWASKHGLPRFNTDEYTQSLDAVCQRLGVQTGQAVLWCTLSSTLAIPCQEHKAGMRVGYCAGVTHNKANSKLWKGLEALQYDVEEMPRNCSASSSCGHCPHGCACMFPLLAFVFITNWFICLAKRMSTMLNQATGIRQLQDEDPFFESHKLCRRIDISILCYKSTIDTRFLIQCSKSLVSCHYSKFLECWIRPCCRWQKTRCDCNLSCWCNKAWSHYTHRWDMQIYIQV